MGEAPALVPLGVVVAPHGVRGELKVRLHNPESALLEALHGVWLRDGGGCRRAEVRTTRRQGQGLLVTLAGCTSRSDAEALRGAEMCVTRSELPALSEGEVYLLDLVGLAARTPDGADAGVVEGTIVYPSATVLRVRSREGVREVPYLAPYVTDVRVGDGFVVVDRLDEIELLRDRRAR